MNEQWQWTYALVLFKVDRAQHLGGVATGSGGKRARGVQSWGCAEQQ